MLICCSGSAPPPAPSTGARRSSVDIDSTYDHLDSKRSSSGEPAACLSPGQPHVYHLWPAACLSPGSRCSTGTVSIKRPSDLHEYEDPDKGAEYEDPDKDAEYEEISGPEEGSTWFFACANSILDADDDLYVRSTYQIASLVR